jgi:hypothetical protein
MDNDRNLTAREAVVEISDIVTVESCLAVFIFGLALFCQVVDISQHFRHFNRRKSVSRAKVWLIGMTFFNLLFHTMQLLMYELNWIGLEAACFTFVSPFLPLFYCFIKQFVYYVLFERAYVIHVSLQLRNRNFVHIRTLVGFAIVFGVPVAFYWTLFVYFGGRVMIPEGHCVAFTFDEMPLIMFAVADVLLSTLLLALFIYPIWRTLKRLGSSGSTATSGEILLAYVMKRNLILSILITTSTFTGLMGMTVIFTLYHGNILDRDSEHLQILGLLFVSCDLLISGCCALLLTTSWIPQQIRVRCLTHKWKDLDQEVQKQADHMTALPQADDKNVDFPPQQIVEVQEVTDLTNVNTVDS